MAYNRSFKFYGIGVGTIPAEIIATFNGIELYSGPIATVTENVFSTSSLWDINQVLFTLDDSSEFNTEFSGIVPLSITVTNNVLVAFDNVTANYFGMPNPAFSPEQYAIMDNPNSTPIEIANVLIEAANPPFTDEEKALVYTLCEVWPDRADELNTLRQAHNVEYTVYSPNSWESCFTPVPNPNPDYPWMIPGLTTLNCNLDIIAFP
jgi:hypothetical protein